MTTAAPTVHTMPGTVDIPIASFPASKITNTDALQTAQAFVDTLNGHIAKADTESLASLFLENGFWRDHLALTWEFRTVQSPSKISQFLAESAASRDGFRLKSVALDTSQKSRTPFIGPVDAEGKSEAVQFFISFETVLGFGAGTIRLAADGAGGWKIYTLATILQGLTGFEELVNHRRPQGVAHGQQPGRTNWADRREAAENYTDGSEPSVIIVGAGQAGLTAAVRLKMLGVNALIVDKNKRVGDNWRGRYHQLVLHDPVWYDHMPYLPFPSNWPVFTPKDKLAGWFEFYAQAMELNVWMTTTLAQTPQYDDVPGKWTVVLDRTRPDGTSETRTFSPRHIIQATGHSGKKNFPVIKGIESFQGHVLCHSSEFPGARPNGTGKKAVVVGCCNSAHDICHDFYEQGYDVTMVQRSSTHVVTSKAITDIALKALFSETSPPHDDADLILHGIPHTVLKAIQQQVTALNASHDKPLLDGLAEAGFKLDNGPSGSGLFFKYFQRGGGYYIDVGASQLIADKKIKVKQGQEIAEVFDRGLRFADGSELEADEIVFATGYQNMRTQAREMYGDALADRVKDVWGLNEEGEFRTMWQNSGHPGFWFHGGNMALCRYYSRLLALQIKGLEAGLYDHGEK